MLSYYPLAVISSLELPKSVCVCVFVKISTLLRPHVANSEFSIGSKGSELSRKVREAVPVCLVRVWSESDVTAPIDGQQTVLFMITIDTFSIL